MLITHYVKPVFKFINTEVNILKQILKLHKFLGLVLLIIIKVYSA